MVLRSSSRCTQSPSTLVKLLLFLLACWTSPSEAMSLVSSSNKDIRPLGPVQRVLSLGAPALRRLALTAAAREEQAEEPIVDLMGIVWLEHINMVVGSKTIAEYFYQDFLGLTLDPTARFHVNLGQQQFHLDDTVKRTTGENHDDDDNDETLSPQPTSQVICGSIGLVVPSLSTVRRRLDDALVRLRETQFRVIAEHDPAFDNDKNNINTEQPYITVSCPFGNILHIYGLENRGGGGGGVDQQQRQPPADSGVSSTDSSPRQKMVQLHARGGPYSHSTRIGVRSGQPGIRYIEIACRSGTANRIGRFYEQMLGCTVHHQLDSCCSSSSNSNNNNNDYHQPNSVVSVVSAGPGVHLIFTEVIAANDHEDDETIHHYHQQRLDQMKGVHICIYTAPLFRDLYQRLAGRGLVWTNPRFTHLDSCDTVDEAIASRTLRFKNIIDMETGQVLLELEHETRPTRHGQYLKVPLYDAK